MRRADANASARFSEVCLEPQRHAGTEDDAAGSGRPIASGLSVSVVKT